MNRRFVLLSVPSFYSLIATELTFKVNLQTSNPIPFIPWHATAPMELVEGGGFKLQHCLASELSLHPGTSHSGTGLSLRCLAMEPGTRIPALAFPLPMSICSRLLTWYMGWRWRTGSCPCFSLFHSQAVVDLAPSTFTGVSPVRWP